MLYFAIVILTLFTVISILRLGGLFEIATQPKKAEDTVLQERRNKNKRKWESRKLQLYQDTCNLFRGIVMNDLQYENHKYYIARLNIRSKTLGRQLTPEELRGKYVLIVLLSLLVIPLAVFYPICIFVPMVALAYFFTYPTTFKAKINDEDELIDNYFIDLYLLLYSKLRQGSRARLQGTVEQYISVLESQGNVDYRDAMLNLSKTMLNLLSQYEDHVAIPMLRETYHSATIINFCNVASQALQGIDNFDNLLTFKMQLVERKTNLMRKRQQAILRKGERSIYAIWIILFIFIVVGWYSKLPVGMFDSMF